MSIWTYIAIEAFCTFNHMSKKQHTYFKVLDTKKFKVDKKHPHIEKNEGYISPTNRPKWCVKKNRKFVPQFRCLCDNKNQKCLFFAFCEADSNVKVIDNRIDK